MYERLTVLLLLATSSFAFDGSSKRAEDLYQHTDYSSSLKLLLNEPAPDAGTYTLIGKNYYMLGDYKKAIDNFQKAASLDSENSEIVHWIGRCYGRKAETSSPFLAPANASKARQYFERAIELDPKNEEALNDLFDYYLQAPGFLGGGTDKAAALARKIGEINPAEYHFAQAQLAQKKKEYVTAEEQLRRAIALAPRQVGRVVDLAKYLARQGRYQESDAVFHEAEQIAPNSPKVMFAKAHLYVEQKRNLDEAKILLEKYLQSNLTPEDPPKEEARKLLSRATSTGA